MEAEIGALSAAGRYAFACRPMTNGNSYAWTSSPPPLGSPWDAVQMGAQAWVQATQQR